MFTLILAATCKPIIPCLIYSHIVNDLKIKFHRDRSMNIMWGDPKESYSKSFFYWKRIKVHCSDILLYLEDLFLLEFDNSTFCSLVSKSTKKFDTGLPLMDF